jgi:CRP/FNR family transcriptional regulator, cyclic AMP receptor protein
MEHERFRWLEALTDSQRRTLAPLTRLLAVRRGHPVYRPGDPNDEIFFLKAGVVKITTFGPAGNGRIVAFRYPGDAFGELALVDDGRRDHLAEAHEDVSIFSIERGVLLRLVCQTPELNVHLLKLMAARLRGVQARVQALLCGDARGRVAHVLLDLAADCGVADADGILIPLRVSQRDLANLAGLTRETVNGVLADLRNRGLIEADRRSIRVKNPDALRSVHS